MRASSALHAAQNTGRTSVRLPFFLSAMPIAAVMPSLSLQIEVLVTLEEYCGGEGTFEGPDSGALYTPFFGHLLIPIGKLVDPNCDGWVLHFS